MKGAFKLMTVNDINQKEFTISKRGYEQDEVRQFMQQVAEQIHKLEAEKASLIKKLEVLAHKIEEYKRDEQSIQAALLGAQKLAKTTVSEAQQQADKLKQEISQKSTEVLRKAKSESDKMVSESKELSQQLLAKSKVDADKMIADAKSHVEKTLHDSRYTIEKEQANLLRIQKEVSMFKKELLDIYRQHIDVIQKLPETEESKVADEREVRELKNDLYKQQLDEHKVQPLKEENSTDVLEDPTTQGDASAMPSEEGHPTQIMQGFSNAEPEAEQQGTPSEDALSALQENVISNRFMELQFGNNK